MLQWDSFTIVNQCLLHNSTLKYGISYRPLDQRGECWNYFGGQNAEKEIRKHEMMRTPKEARLRPDRGPNQLIACDPRLPSATLKERPGNFC